MTNKPALELLRQRKELKLQITMKNADLPLESAFLLLARDIFEAHVRLITFIQSNGGNEGAIPPELEQKLLILKSDLEQKRQAGKDTLDRDKQLRIELTALNEELAALPTFPGIDKLLAINAELVKVKDEITALIAAQEETPPPVSGAVGAADLETGFIDVEKMLVSRIATAWEKLAELVEAQELAMKELLNHEAAHNKDDFQVTLAEALTECGSNMLAIDALLDRFAPSRCPARFVTSMQHCLKSSKMSENSQAGPAETINMNRGLDIMEEKNHG